MSKSQYTVDELIRAVDNNIQNLPHRDVKALVAEIKRLRGEPRPDKARVVDYGKPEYLDGALMQYTVDVQKRTLAYVGEKEDAELFAEAWNNAHES